MPKIYTGFQGFVESSPQNCAISRCLVSHPDIIPEEICKLAHTKFNRLIIPTFTIDLIYLELGPEISREMSCRP